MRSCWEHIMYPTRVYSTIVSVKIADTRLARLNCVCNAAILIYVFLYTIGYQNRHLEFGDISGTTMFMLKRPTLLNASEWWLASDTDRINTQSNFPPAEDQAYCSQSTAAYPLARKLECEYWESGDQELNRAAADNSAFVPTRATFLLETKQNASCANSTNSNARRCGNTYRAHGERRVYPVAPEKTELMIMSSMQVRGTAGLNASVGLNCVVWNLWDAQRM